jgi:hypothetical protein
MFSVVLVHRDRVWASLVVEEVCLPKGPLGGVRGLSRVRFLRDRGYVSGVALSQFRDGTTVLSERDVRGADWLAGTVAAVYGAEPGADLRAQVAVKEHAAHAWQVHPSAVVWRPGDRFAALADDPSRVRAIEVRDESGRTTVRDSREPIGGQP